MLTAAQLKALEEKTMLDSVNTRYIIHKVKGNPKQTQVMGKVVGEVSTIVGDYKHVLHKIEGEFLDGSKHAYRSGYWTYRGDGKHIVWGQYTQFLTQKEYKALLAKAKEAGWDIF